MMLRLLAAGLVAAIGCGPAFADVAKPAAAPPVATGPSPAAAPAAPSPRLSNLADLVFAGIVGENAPELTADLTAGFSLGTMSLQFEKTGLAELATAFGGQVHAQGDPGSAASWVCYTQHARTKADTPRTAWFVGDDRSGGPGNILNLLVVEDVDAAKVSGCTTAPKSFAWPAFGVPAIGASVADLKAKFGVAPRDRQGNVYYDSARATGDGSGKSVYQTLGYVLNRKGTVLGLALGQMTN